MHIGTFFNVPLIVSRWFLLMVGMMSAVGYQEDGIRGIFAFNALLVFIYICVALHEYGHVAAGTKVGLSFSRVTLGAFGGVASIQGEEGQPFSTKLGNWQEFFTTICGPLVNLLIAGTLFALMHLFGTFDIQHAEALRINTELMQWGPIQPHEQSAYMTWFSVSNNLDTVDDFLVVLLFSNIAMCVFNMLPTYPMDGGRILRCILRIAFSFSTSTKIVTYISQVLCVFLFYLGTQMPSFGPMVISTVMFIVCFSERSALTRSASADKFVDVLQRINAELNNTDTSAAPISSFDVSIKNEDESLCTVDLKALVAAANVLRVPLDERLILNMPFHLGSASDESLEHLRKQIGEDYYAEISDFIAISKNLVREAQEQIEERQQHG